MPRGLGAMLSVSLAAALLGILHIGAPMRQYYLGFVPQIALAASLGLVTLFRERAPRTPLAAWATAIAVLAVCVAPSAWSAYERHAPRGEQERFLREVVAVTQPGDRVFDCWTGLYLTRLPAYRHFFLLSDVFRVLDPKQLESDLLVALANPDVKVVIADTHFRLLPDAVRMYVQREFAQRPGFEGLLVRR